jgi:hypothetical protein
MTTNFSSSLSFDTVFGSEMGKKIYIPDPQRWWILWIKYHRDTKAFVSFPLKFDCRRILPAFICPLASVTPTLLKIVRPERPQNPAAEKKSVPFC